MDFSSDQTDIGNQGNPNAGCHSNLLPGTWRCAVCAVPSNQMTTLPCQHKFCEKCFNLWIGIYIDMYRGNGGRFPCQICWTLYEVPDNGLKAFKQDFTVHQLESQLGRLGMDTVTEETGVQHTVDMTTSPSQQEEGGALDQSVDQSVEHSAASFRHAGFCLRSHPLYAHMI